MDRKKIISLYAAIVVIIFTASQSEAISYQINDNQGTFAYVGSNDHGYGDVIGGDAEFDIFGANVSKSATTLRVDIYTNFVGYAGIYGGSGYTGFTEDPLRGKTDPGIGYGDLFLSETWDPEGSSPYLYDNYDTGTVWTYGFQIDDHWGAGGSGRLYQLNKPGGNFANSYLSEDYTKTGIFREGQEVVINSNDLSEYEIEPTIDGFNSWRISTANTSVADRFITFEMDISGTEIVDWDTIAIHWGMTCGNDVIEGTVTTVPEPTCVVFLGPSLLGLIVARRKPKK